MKCTPLQKLKLVVIIVILFYIIFHSIFISVLHPLPNCLLACLNLDPFVHSVRALSSTQSAKREQHWKIIIKMEEKRKRITEIKMKSFKVIILLNPFDMQTILLWCCWIQRTSCLILLPQNLNILASENWNDFDLTEENTKIKLETFIIRCFSWSSGNSNSNNINNKTCCKFIKNIANENE